MSALGHKRTFAPQKAMSALPPKADMCGATRYVRFVPIADMSASQRHIRLTRKRMAAVMRVSATVGKICQQLRPVPIMHFCVHTSSLLGDQPILVCQRLQHL